MLKEVPQLFLNEAFFKLRKVSLFWGMKIQVVVNFTPITQTLIGRGYVSLEK